MFEGDLLLTKQQRENILKGLPLDSTTKRGAVAGHLWPNGIMVYKINPRLGKFLLISVTLTVIRTRGGWGLIEKESIFI